MDIEILKKLRKKAKINQTELAKSIGVSASAIGMYEQGRRKPDHETLVKLSEFFGVSVDMLLGLKEKEDVAYIDKSEITSEILKSLAQQEALMFSANAMHPEDYEKIQNAIEIAVDIALKKQTKK